MVCMTLDCVGITQSSVIRIIHRNVGLKHFFHLSKLLLVFAYIYISQGSVETHLLCRGHIIITLLQIVCRVCQWKNFENWSKIGEDMDKSKVSHFYGPRCRQIAANQQCSLTALWPTCVVLISISMTPSQQWVQTQLRYMGEGPDKRPLKYTAVIFWRLG